MCDIEGCHKPVVARGWCEAHYTRWKRYGNPLTRVKMRGDAIRFFNEVVLTYEGDECLKWPYTTDNKGYGWVSVEGVGKKAHAAVCEAIYGPRPQGKVAAHSCGKGHEGCCTKNHLRWATRKENGEDMVKHGTSSRGERQGASKLKSEEVLKIFALKGTMTQKQVAAIYSVNQNHIGRIWRGEQWAWLTLPE